MTVGIRKEKKAGKRSSLVDREIFSFLINTVSLPDGTLWYLRKQAEKTLWNSILFRERYKDWQWRAGEGREGGH